MLVHTIWSYYTISVLFHVAPLIPIMLWWFKPCMKFWYIINHSTKMCIVLPVLCHYYMVKITMVIVYFVDYLWLSRIPNGMLIGKQEVILFNIVFKTIITGLRYGNNNFTYKIFTQIVILIRNSSHLGNLHSLASSVSHPTYDGDSCC